MNYTQDQHYNIRMPKALTMLENWPVELWASGISHKEVEKEIIGSAKSYLYFIRDYQENPDEDFNCSRSDSNNDLGAAINSIEIERNLEQDSNSIDMNYRLRRLLKEYQNVFREKLPEGLPLRHTVNNAIETSNASPVNNNAYLLSIQ